MTEPTPYYQRTLDSFADHIITKARPNKDGGWHAVLDCSFKSWVSDPDFSPYGYGKDATEAHSRSAHAIRNDAIGIGKYAPHAILKDCYDLHWRLMKHWDRKERFEAVGVNPNDMVIAAADVDWAEWPLSGEWLDRCSDTRTIEFVFQLSVAETGFAVREGKLDIDQAKDTILNAVREEFADSRFRARPTAETWTKLEERIDNAVLDISSSLGGPKI
jgi:hypothetical protein